MSVDSKVNKEHEVPQDHLGLLESQDHQDLQDLAVRQVRQDVLEHLVAEDNLDQSDHPERLVHQARLDLEELKESVDLEGKEAVLVRRVLQEEEARLAQPAKLAVVVPLANRVVVGNKENVVNLARVEDLEAEDVTDHLVNL